MTAIVELKNVTKAVSNGMNEEKVILDDVSLEIREHDFITILGGNGAGKSTLFNTIAGTLPVSSGKIYILGEDVTKYHKTLTTYVNGLIKAGFCITHLVEPQPDESMLDTVPEMRDELRRPMMLLIAARKN